MEVCIQYLRGNKALSSIHTTHGQICNGQDTPETVTVFKNVFMLHSVNQQVLFHYFSDCIYLYMKSETDHENKDMLVFGGRRREKLWQNNKG